MNDQIQDLANAMADAPRRPKRTVVLEAMRLAYEVGKNDGALEATQRLLKKVEGDKEKAQ